MNTGGNHMMTIVPALNFDGHCRDALHLYEKAFGGTITRLITYREADDPMYNPPAERESKGLDLPRGTDD